MSFEQPISIEAEKAKFEQELFSQLSLKPGGSVEGEKETSLYFDHNHETGDVEREWLEASTKRPDGIRVLEGRNQMDFIWEKVQRVSSEGANAFLQEQLHKREAELLQRIDNASKWVELFKKEGREKEAERAEKDLERYRKNLTGFQKEKERLMVEKK
ncbi:MAG: hypothetical protein NTX55_00830 [Candidatus Parcubacteria bacterium]|nr:hypothetical protein [Candidatus Parcubacteria bacterium]